MWHGRGAAECKGNIIMHLTALRALGGEMTVNLKLVVAGSEAHVQIPWDIPTGKTSIALSANGQLSNTIDAPVVSAAPAILSVLHADGTPVNGDHPARAGRSVRLRRSRTAHFLT